MRGRRSNRRREIRDGALPHSFSPGVPWPIECTIIVRIFLRTWRADQRAEPVHALPFGTFVSFSWTFDRGSALSLLRHVFRPNQHPSQERPLLDSDFELEQFAPRAARSPPSRYRRASLAYRLAAGSVTRATMKFSHSLLFNAVPDWNNHYLACVQTGYRHQFIIS